MPFALIYGDEPRVYQVAPEAFEVAPPFAWRPCLSEVTPQTHKYEGGQFVALPVVPTPVPVPQSVTPRQARLALLAAGLLDDVNAAVAAAGPQAQIDWDYALEIRRDNALIASMAAGLNLTDEQIDDLFRAAAVL